uniref:carboxylesterase n=1 Tax=Stomoxys calcitrans TaxID=35570 RepID=A0A1I8NNU3_STOCA
MKLAIVIILLAFLNLSLVVTFYLLKLSHIRHCPWILVNIKGQGWVLGSYDFTAWSKQRFMQFRGIPYAEAPSGPKRFKAPVPKRPWTSFFDATKYGRSCPALRSIPQPLGKGDLEDCLNLCVYTKKEFFSPVVDDLYGVIPKEPLALMKDFKQPISVLTGFTKHDGSFAVAIHYDEVHKTQLNVSDMRVQEFAEGLVNIINNQVRLSENVSKLLFSPQLLSSHNHKMAIPAYIDLASIEFMKYPVLLFAHHLLEKGLAPVYLYTLDYEGQHTRFGYGFSTEHYPFNGGVHHSDDNLYLFSTHSLNKRDTKVSQNMVELWTSFAITGIPKLHCGPKIVSMQDDLGPYISINQKIIIKSNVSKELTVATKDPCKHKLIRSNKRFLNFKSPKCF